MKSLVRIALVSLVVASLPGIRAESLPDFRPALMGNFRRALVNLIDTKALVKQGQKDAVVFFTCRVEANGLGGVIDVYRCTANSELLQQQLLERNPVAMYEPGVFQHHQVVVKVTGTAVFVVREGQPHLRIFLNPEEEDLKRARDFIAPQFAFAPGNTFASHLRPPTYDWTRGGVALLNLDIDLAGKVQGVNVAYEYPPGLGLGAAAAEPIRYALFIPGFRDGKAVACRFTYPVLFQTGRKTKVE